MVSMPASQRPAEANDTEKIMAFPPALRLSRTLITCGDVRMPWSRATLGAPRQTID